MTVYSYKVVDKNGNEINGEYDAKERDMVSAYLHEQGHTVLSIEEKVNYFEEIFAFGSAKISLKNKVILVKQLSTMLQAGVSITQALQIIIQQAQDKTLQKNMQKVLEDIQKSGMSLSESLTKNTKIFNNVQINLIKAGEASGNLNEILYKVAVDLEKTQILRSRIRSAMIYPVIIFAIIIVVMVVMMVYMIPAVESLYKDFGLTADQLPAATRVLVSISNFVGSARGFSIIVVVLLSLILGLHYYKSTPGGRLMIDRFYLKLPVFGKLIALIEVSEFCRLLSMLIKSGVPIIKGLEIVASALSNIHFQNALVNSLTDISNGTPIAVPLARSEVYPPLIVKMIAIGEETGKLDSVLDDMAKYYDSEVEEITNNLSRLMEPMVLVIVGTIVGFLAIGIYLPIYSIGNSIS